MDNRQTAMFNRIEQRLVAMLSIEADWKDSAGRVAEALDLSTPDYSSPKAFGASLEPKLAKLAREAVSRGMAPRDLDSATDPLELVDNLR